MRIVVQEWERVLLYVDGRFAEQLGPGAHRRRRRRTRVVRLPVRTSVLAVPGQEVLTADGLSVKVSLVGACAVTDARVFHEAVEDPLALLYATAQVALRTACATRTLDELLAAREALAAEVASASAVTAARVGVVLESLDVKDLMVPAELRRVAAEVATARAQGQAALERARGEVAATRALANAAKLVADNPALLQLRTLQAVESGGATVVLHSPTP